MSVCKERDEHGREDDADALDGVRDGVGDERDL